MKHNPETAWEDLLIESVLRDIIKEENVKTWEDFKQIMGVALKAKELEKLKTAGGAAGKAAKNLLGLVPGIGTVKSAMSLGGQLRDLADVVKMGGEMKDSQAEKSELFSLFNIDDGYTEIVDNDLEDEFLNWLPGWIGEKTGNIDPKLDNANAMFEEFLKQRGSYDETVTDADPGKKFTDIEMPEKEPLKDAMKSMASAAKGFWNNLF